MRGMISVMIAAAAAGALMLIPASPAQASACYTKHHPSDPSWITVCDRSTIAVCDADQDGHKTYARFRPFQTPKYLLTQYDSYGTTNGQFCYHERPTSAWGLEMVAICVQYEGCGKWRDAGGPSRLLRGGGFSSANAASG